jgi:subtilisin family serine protease
VGSILGGLDFILRSRLRSPQGLMVANLSWGTMAQNSPVALTSLVNALVAHGVTVVVSGGNEAGNACDKMPASLVDTVLTVGASDIDDRAAGYSNGGKCVTLWAPGTSVTSAWPTGSKNSQATLSGTSAAAAHVTGVVALLMERFPNDANPQAIKKRLLEMAERDVLIGLKDESVNLLLNMGDLALTK